MSTFEPASAKDLAVLKTDILLMRRDIAELSDQFTARIEALDRRRTFRMRTERGKGSPDATLAHIVELLTVASGYAMPIQDLRTKVNKNLLHDAALLGVERGLLIRGKIINTAKAGRPHEVLALADQPRLRNAPGNHGRIAWHDEAPPDTSDLAWPSRPKTPVGARPVHRSHQATFTRVIELLSAEPSHTLGLDTLKDDPGVNKNAIADAIGGGVADGHLVRGRIIDPDRAGRPREVVALANKPILTQTPEGLAIHWWDKPAMHDAPDDRLTAADLDEPTP